MKVSLNDKSITQEFKNGYEEGLKKALEITIKFANIKSSKLGSMSRSGEIATLLEMHLDKNNKVINPELIIPIKYE